MQTIRNQGFEFPRCASARLFFFQLIKSRKFSFNEEVMEDVGAWFAKQDHIFF